MESLEDLLLIKKLSSSEYLYIKSKLNEQKLQTKKRNFSSDIGNINKIVNSQRWLTMNEVQKITGEIRETVRRKCKKGQYESISEFRGHSKIYYINPKSLNIDRINFLDNQIKILKRKNQKFKIVYKMSLDEMYEELLKMKEIYVNLSEIWVSVKIIANLENNTCRAVRYKIYSNKYQSKKMRSRKGYRYKVNLTSLDIDTQIKYIEFYSSEIKKVINNFAKLSVLRIKNSQNKQFKEVKNDKNPN